MTSLHLVLNLDDESTAHLRTALRAYLDWLARTAQRSPSSLRELHQALAPDARRRLAPQPVDAPARTFDGYPMTPRLLTYDGAAHLLALSTRQVQRLVADGDLPVVRIGGASRVRTADVDAFIATHIKEHPCR